MKLRTFATIFLLFLTSLALFGAAREKSELESYYDKAFSAFDAEHYDEALKALDAIDARQPNLAESLNLRGVVLMRQGKYDKAEAALRKALSIEPRFWNASFNLAEIPFLKKDWPEARNRFEGLMSGDDKAMQPETSRLIQYKILLTFVQQGKEGTVDWMLNKFESSKDSPALYYSNAALAFEHGNEKEAQEWLASAKKQYSPALNKLYSEALYEIGWMQKPAGESRAALEITSEAERTEQMKADAKANFEKAERAFQQHDFDGATSLLDLAMAASPNEPPFFNLRGEILMEQKKLDEAEAAFRQAIAADPKFHEAQYNLAQISFKKKEYAKARERFESLFAQTSGDEKNQAAQLVKFKIFMTLLLEGKDAEARQLMDQFKFTGETPALYYAQAAWEFKHGRAEEANDWAASARKIYSAPLNIIFADSFYDLGWLQRSGSESLATTSALAQAAGTPSDAPTPAMRLGQAEPLPAPDLPPDETTSATGAPASAATESATPANVATSAAATPAASVASVATPPAKSAIVAAKPNPNPTTTSATSSATKTLAAAQPHKKSAPNFAGKTSQSSSMSTLLVVGLLLAGILLLAGLVVQQFRRSLSTTPLYKSATLATDPSFVDDREVGETHQIAGDLVTSGPPKISLNLKATEPSIRTAVLPSGAITARGIAPGVDEPPVAAPNEPEKLAAEISPAPEIEETVPAEAEASTLRDREEVSLPAASVAADEPMFTEAVESAATFETPIIESPDAPSFIDEPATEAVTAAAPPMEIAEEIGEETATPEFVVGTSAASHEPIWMEEEPVGQGQPVPDLTTALSPEPVLSELTQPEPESDLVLIEPEATVASPIIGREAAQSSIESPSFTSKILTTEPIRLQPNTPYPMPETTITPVSPAPYPTHSTMSVQQPAGGMHTAVQLTFSLEIASMQLTPTFKMSGLQLKPTSKIVSMRLAPSQDPQPPMNLQVTFEVAKIELVNGAIGTVRLSPSVREKPAVLTSPSFAISGLELVANSGSAPVQLTPSHQEQASVHLTAHFQIAAIEFTPLFEIAAIVLNSTSRNVSMQLPGSGPTSIDNAPVFQIEQVQLSGSDLGTIQVVPGAASLGA